MGVFIGEAWVPGRFQFVEEVQEMIVIAQKDLIAANTVQNHLVATIVNGLR